MAALGGVVLELEGGGAKLVGGWIAGQKAFEQGAALGFLLLILSTAIVWLGLTVSRQNFGDVMRRS